MRVPDKIAWHISYKEKTTEKEAEYIAKILRKFIKRKSQILEVACGNGRLHKILRKYFDVYGIDISKELIEEAKKKNRKFEENYFIGDMRNFKIDKKFDAIFFWFTSFGYFNDKGNLETLKNANKHLKENGILLLDIPNKNVKEKEVKRVDKFWLEYKEFVELAKNNISKNAQTFWVIKQYFYKKRGKDLKFVKRSVKKVRIYSKKELNNLLKKANFRIIKIFESMTMKKASENKSRQFLIVARKIGPAGI